MQADPNKKNMERMEERVRESDQQQLNHMLTDSKWDHQAVMDQVALEADRRLGGHRNNCLLIDESGFRKSGKHSVGVAVNGAADGERSIIAKSVFLRRWAEAIAPHWSMSGGIFRNPG